MYSKEMSYNAHIEYYLHIIDKNKRLGRNKAHIPHKISNRYVAALEDMGYKVTNETLVEEDFLFESIGEVRTRLAATIEWGD